MTDIGGGTVEDAEVPMLDTSDFGGGGGARKYVFLGLGVLGVIILFILIFTAILSFTRRTSLKRKLRSNIGVYGRKRPL